MALVVVGAATSSALAVYASAWLVAPYLALMALVVGVPNPLPHVRTLRDRAGLRRDLGHVSGRAGGALRARWARAMSVASRAASRAATAPGPESPAELPAGSDAGDEPAASPDAAGPEPGSDPDDALDPGSPSAKARRGRGKGRKPKPGAVALPTGDDPAGSATWVRVGPGKFVRADSLSPTPPPPTAFDGPAVAGATAGEAAGVQADPEGLDRSPPADVAATAADPVPSPEAPVHPGPADATPEGAGPDAPEAAHAAEVVVEPPAPEEVADAAASWTEPTGDAGAGRPEPDAPVGVADESAGDAWSGAEPPGAVAGESPGGPRDDGHGPGDSGVGADVPVDDDPTVPGRAVAEAAFRAPASAGTQESVGAREWSEAVEPGAAVEPGPVDAAETVREGGFGVRSFGPGVAVVDAPGVTVGSWSGDNGIAPDAPAFARRIAPPLGGPSHHDLEAAPAPTFPDPTAAEPGAPVPPVAPGFDPPEAATAPLPTLAGPAERQGVGEVRLTPAPPAARSFARGRLASSVRVALPRAARPAAIAVGRSAFGSGPPRRTRPARTLGPRRGPRRVRNAGRFRKADRCHPPRSPPATAGRGRTPSD